MKRVVGRAEAAESLDELLGLEGWAARIYFGLFAGMVKRESDGEGDQGLSFDFAARNRRPPRDPVNALLSLGYSLLVKDLTVACYAVGFDPMIGVLPSAPSRAARLGARSDGAAAPPHCRLGSAERREYQDGLGAETS